MSATDTIRALARSPYFRGISTDVLHSIAMHMTLQPVVAGEVLSTRLQPSEAVWLIADGRVEVRRLQGYKGRRVEVPVSILRPGMFFGHVGLLSEQPRTATWVAASPGLLLRLDRKPFERLLADPRMTGSAFRRAMILALGSQLQAVNARLNEFIADPEAEVATRKELLRDAMELVDRGGQG
jgi:CRP-like cAMP-binding protein